MAAHADIAAGGDNDQAGDSGEYLTQTGSRKPKFLYGGFAYCVNKTVRDRSYWRCCRYNELKCRGKLTTVGGKLVGEPSTHNHEPDASLISTARARDQLKERAAGTQETTQNIISAVVTDLTPSQACALPSVSTLRKSVQRARSRASNVPANPASLADLEIPETYSQTSDGLPFLVHDSGPLDGDQRLLIFASATALDLLVECDHWLGDGTFKTVPRLFSQLYSIHVTYRAHVVPVAYALLPNKQQATYSRMFNALSQLRPELAPELFTVDFELGAINAFKDKFPDAQVQGCYFHMCQNIFKHVQSSGLQERYGTDLEFALEVRKLAALAFVPPGDVAAYFDILQESDLFPDEAEPVMDYFEEYYIGRRRRNGQRKTPMFPIPLWNVHDATLAHLPRTNNNIEGWHRRFGGHLLCNHPTIWKFVEALQREEKETGLLLERTIAGEEGPRRKRKYVAVDRRLRALCQTFEQRPPLDFLRGVAHNLQFQQN